MVDNTVAAMFRSGVRTRKVTFLALILGMEIDCRRIGSEATLVEVRLFLPSLQIANVRK
jgi:hypothetical protein